MSILEDQYTIKLHDTDAAGILFFTNQLKIAHDIYEKFLNQIGFSLADRFSRRDFFLPIVHAEADYCRPLVVGDVIRIALSVENIGRASFTLKYSLSNLNGKPVGSAVTVHVTTDPDTGGKIELPEDFRTKMEKVSKAGN
jgi:1,4-dihydroxy-2-naphthoyl-CoA hydrolase